MRTILTNPATLLPSRMRTGFSAILCMLLLSAGCGRSLESSVSGVATFDGKPLPRGSVSFFPTEHGAAAAGTIQSDGTYEIRTGRGKGLAAGDYLVTVIAREPLTAELAAAMKLPKPITPTRYQEVKTTDLRCAVKPGANRIDLELKP